jgi:TM2 domain-containing membrane protein YozV
MPDDESDDNWVSDSVDDDGGDATDPDDSPVDTGEGDGQAAEDRDLTAASDDGQSRGREKGPNEKFCVECGAAINEKAEICPECGVRQPGTGSGSDDERLIAALLAIFLGGIGAHKFYLGKTTQGLLYLCFFWTAIPALIGIIEGVIYLSKSDEEFRQQYLGD